MLSVTPVRVIALGLGLLTASGCIVPQDDHVLEPLTPVLNRPPRIVPETVSPSGQKYKLANGLNCAVKFQGAVEDQDVSDVINYIFTVDFETANPIVAKSDSLPNSNKAIRSTPASIEFRAATGGGTSVPKIFDVGNHVVQLIVADGQLNSTTLTPNQDIAPTFPDGGINLRFTDTQTWFVETVPGDCALPDGGT